RLLDAERQPGANAGRERNRTPDSWYDWTTSSRDGRARRPIGEWIRGRVLVAEDGTVTHYLNGIKMFEYKRGSQEYRDLVAASQYKDWDSFGEAPEGHILLQDHGDEVSFRNIKVKKLK